MPERSAQDQAPDLKGRFSLCVKIAKPGSLKSRLVQAPVSICALQVIVVFGEVERRDAAFGPHFGIGFGIQQRVDGLGGASRCHAMQGRKATVAPRLDICPCAQAGADILSRCNLKKLMRVP